MSVDLEVIKSTMTCIHIIIRNTPNKQEAFDSIDDLRENISASLGSNLTPENDGGFYGDEILESLPSSIEWMKNRGIITVIEDSNMNKSIIGVNKDKLVEYIIDPNPKR
jgi:hypothetical protein